MFHVLLRYIQKYTEKFGLKKYLKLDTAVTNVTYENKRFTVTVQTWKDNKVVSFLLSEWIDISKCPIDSYALWFEWFRHFKCLTILASLEWCTL